MAPAQVPGPVVRRAGQGVSGRPAAACPSPVARRQPSRLIRKVRGLSLLATLIAVPTTLVLSLADILLWVSVAISGGAFVLCLAWLRVGARREQAARRAVARRARAQRDAARPVAAAQRGPARPVAAAQRGPARPVAPTTTVAPAGARAEATASSSTETGSLEHAFVDAWAIGRAGDQAAPAPEVVARADDDDWSADLPAGSTWSPVNVPLPTYALKEPARPRTVVPAATTVATPAPAEDLFDQQAPSRRAVGD